MNPADVALGIVLLPLLAGFALCAWQLVVTRAGAVGLVGLLLAGLAVVQLSFPLPRAESFGEMVLTGALGLLGGWLVVNTLAALTALVLLRTVRDRNRAEELQWRSMESVRALADFFSAERAPFEVRLARLLEIGARELELPVATLSRIDGQRYEIVSIHAPDGFDLAPGDCLELGRTFCRETVERTGAVAFESLAGRSPHDPAHARLGYQSYLGVAIRVEGELYGTLSFASPEPRGGRFTGVEHQLIELMAHWVETEVSRLKLERESIAKRLVPRRSDEADRRRVDVNGALVHLEDELRAAVGPNTELVFDLGGFDAFARMYRYEFDRVLWSLLLHGVESCDEDIISIETREVEHREPHTAAAFLTLAVSTTGRGLDPDEQARLLTSPRAASAPRGHPLHARKENLLSLMRIQRLLVDVGGDLSIHSELGAGTTFTAWLPVAAASPDVRQSGSGHAAPDDIDAG